MKRLWLTIFLMFATLGVALGQTTTTSLTTSDPDGTAWNAGTYSIQYINSIPGKPYNTSTGAFITTLYTGSLNSSGALSLTLDDVKYVSPANGTWAFTICPNVSGGASNCSTVNIPVTGASENVSSLVNAALRAPRPGGGVGAYGYADVEFQSIPGNTYVVSPALTAQRCYAGSWAACGSGGGGGLPTAATGQIITNTSGSTTYAGQANIFYQQSGDTIASIEAACSSACTYVVTSPQTITLAASHAMNSNVWLRFEADGKWTVNGSTYVLSNVQVAPGTTTTAHFPAGSGSLTLSSLNALVPVEWFGAVGDWNGTTGTNNLTAIQTAINATTYGQVLLQSLAYAIGGTLNFTASYVGMRGTPASGGTPSRLVETVAGDTAVSEVGSSGTYLVRNVFEYFNVYSSVAQTGTTAGVLFSFTGGVTVQNVNVVDFFHDFSIHASPSYGNGGFFHDAGGWSSLSSAMTNPVAFYLPSTDGVAEDSINLNYDSASVATGGPTQPIGLLSTGTAINDQDITNFATAGINGMEFIYTGSGGADTCSDIQIVTPTIDNFPSIGVEVSGCPPAASGRVAVSGGYIMAGPSTVSTNGAVYVLNSSGFTIYGTQIGVIAPGTAATFGVNFSGSGTSGGIASNVTCMNQPNCVYWQANANNNSATGNVAINETGSAYATAFHVGSGSSYNQISANTTVGLWTDGLILDSGVTNNTYGLNNWSSGTTTSVSDSGTGNGLQNSLSVNGIIYALGASGIAPTNKASAGFLFDYPTGNLFEVGGYGANSSTVPDVYLAGKSSDASLSDFYLHGVYNTSVTISDPLIIPALDQSAAKAYGGTCAMSTSTSCTITLGHTYTTPVCIVTQQSATLTGGAAGCTVSGTTVTITAAVANSETWGALVFGNPS